MSSTGRILMSVRRMVKLLHYKTPQQRHQVELARRNAETLTDGGRASAKAKQLEPPPLCFVEVCGEGDVQRNFFSDGALSGVSIGVCDALDVKEYRTRYGLDSPLLHHMPRREFPFVSWLRRQGAQFVGKLCCRTPLCVWEGCMFGTDHPAGVSVSTRACHYAISSTVNGPAAITSAAYHDVVAFKPTAQSFVNFSEGLRVSIPCMSFGITASRIDDLYFLWQVYTSAIQPSALFDDAKIQQRNSIGPNLLDDDGDEEPFQNQSSSTSPPGSTPGTDHHNPQLVVMPMESLPTGTLGDSVTEKPYSPRLTNRIRSIASDRRDKKFGEKLLNNVPLLDGSGQEASSVASSSTGKKNSTTDAKTENEASKRSAQENSNSNSDTINANTTSASSSNTSSSNWWSRYLRRSQEVESLLPHIELSVGYPAAWIDSFCSKHYGSSEEFYKRIMKLVATRNSMHLNQELEIVPLVFDLDMEEVLRAYHTISLFELSRAFDVALSPVSLLSNTTLSNPLRSSLLNQPPASPSPSSSSSIISPSCGIESSGFSPSPGLESGANTAFCTTPGTKSVIENASSWNHHRKATSFSEGALEEMPDEIVSEIYNGRTVTLSDYHRALRTRDSVVRATEEQFRDVDIILVPLLSQPYLSGSIRSVLPLIPFALGGNPMISAQLEKDFPVALIGELGRDTGLFEDSISFFQFVKGTSPAWWRRKFLGHRVPNSPKTVPT